MLFCFRRYKGEIFPLKLTHNTFVVVFRYNKLLIKIKTSLEELGKAIEGFVVMSSELEDIFNCIYEARVPGEWLKSTKPSNPFAYND